MIQYIVGRKLHHPYIKRQSGDFQKFTFDPSKIHNTHSTAIHVYVMSTPCSNFIPVYLLYDTIHREKITTPLQQRQTGDFQKFTFDPSKINNTHSTTIQVYVMSTPCSNFIPVYLLYDTIHREKITTPLHQTPIRRFPKVYVRSI